MKKKFGEETFQIKGEEGENKMKYALDISESFFSNR